jgi:hypothetical protein
MLIVLTYSPMLSVRLANSEKTNPFQLAPFVQLPRQRTHPKHINKH